MKIWCRFIRFTSDGLACSEKREKLKVTNNIVTTKDFGGNQCAYYIPDRFILGVRIWGQKHDLLFMEESPHPLILEHNVLKSEGISSKELGQMFDPSWTRALLKSMEPSIREALLGVVKASKQVIVSLLKPIENKLIDSVRASQYNQGEDGKA